MSTSDSHVRDEGEERLGSPPSLARPALAVATAPLTVSVSLVHSWKVLVELPALVFGGHSPYPSLRKKPRAS